MWVRGCERGLNVSTHGTCRSKGFGVDHGWVFRPTVCSCAGAERCRHHLMLPRFKSCDVRIWKMSRSLKQNEEEGTQKVRATPRVLTRMNIRRTCARAAMRWRCRGGQTRPWKYECKARRGLVHDAVLPFGKPGEQWRGNSREAGGGNVDFLGPCCPKGFSGSPNLGPIRPRLAVLSGGVGGRVRPVSRVVHLGKSSKVTEGNPEERPRGEGCSEKDTD